MKMIGFDYKSDGKWSSPEAIEEARRKSGYPRDHPV